MHRFFEYFFGTSKAFDDAMGKCRDNNLFYDVTGLSEGSFPLTK